MRILLAEDDPTLGDRIAVALRDAAYAVDWSRDGIEAEFLGQTETFDAAVLDLGLPSLDGLSVLGRWRDAGVRFPVLVLTARSQWHDKLAGFNAGADDYLTKPFRIEELIVRLRALIRRSAGHPAPRIEVGTLALDVNAGRFSLDGAPLALTAQEFRILSFLAHHAGKVVSRSTLAEHVYEGGLDPDSNALDVLVSRVRRKLGPGLLRTVRGQGWILGDAA